MEKMKHYKPLPNKKSKTISNDNLPYYFYTLYSLKDGRLAIGGYRKLLIYNMKTYKIDIIIELKYDSPYLKFMYQLNNGKLFYYVYDNSTEGPAEDEYFYNYLIELSDKNYLDKTDILPKESKYNILREYSDNILFGGITYENNSNKFCYATNATGCKRIEKLVKNDENDEMKGKYNITACLNINFINFILLKNNMMAVLTSDKLQFYEIDKFKKNENSVKFKNKPEKLSIFNENFLLIGVQNRVEIYDYKNFKSIKSFCCVYPIKVIYVNQNKVFIGESTRYDLKRGSAYNIINEYELDNNGNYKQVYSYTNPHKNELVDITQVKDGRLITCSRQKVKIWS